MACGQEFDGFEPAAWTDTLSIADLNLDGKMELLMISADALRVFCQLENVSGLGEPERFYITENPYNMLIEDVSGDGSRCFVSECQWQPVVGCACRLIQGW